MNVIDLWFQWIFFVGYNGLLIASKDVWIECRMLSMTFKCSMKSVMEESGGKENRRIVMNSENLNGHKKR